MKPRIRAIGGSRVFRLSAPRFSVCRTLLRLDLLDLAMTGSADAEAVNDCLEPRIGTDWVIFRIDVDE